ncbi:MAG: PadR family transcriptional regulator [Planctomycetota bacterium]|jgi:DNA-binding PadR family transcriptional regulator
MQILDHILLGLLREPLSGYGLKAEFDGTAGHFWPAELSQIYRTLKRLERDGLLASRAEPSDKGPDRRVYRRTAAGRAALKRWLAGEPQFNDERLAYIAQLFFMDELNSLDQTLECIVANRRKRVAQLEAYHRLARSWSESFGGSLENATDEDFHRYLTLQAGIRVAEARLRWCDETAAQISKRAAARRTRGRKQGART